MIASRSCRTTLVEDRILAAKAALGQRAVILGHHYQRADVYKHADLTGDSLQLSELAAQTDAEYIVFCGVHFMAEVADILSKPDQIAILPDLSAGCSMADMANLAEGRARLARARRGARSRRARHAGHLHQFRGGPEGVLRRARRHRLHVLATRGKILEWSFARREKVLFFPDQHLGRWTGYMMDIPLAEMLVWDPDEQLGGLTPQQIKMAKILLWKGHCSVHQMFQPQHILRWREQHPDGMVISHPECKLRRVQALRLRRLHRLHHQDHRRERPRTRAGWWARS